MITTSYEDRGCLREAGAGGSNPLTPTIPFPAVPKDKAPSKPFAEFGFGPFPPSFAVRSGPCSTRLS